METEPRPSNRPSSPILIDLVDDTDDDGDNDDDNEEGLISIIQLMAETERLVMNKQEPLITTLWNLTRAQISKNQREKISKTEEKIGHEREQWELLDALKLLEKSEVDKKSELRAVEDEKDAIKWQLVGVDADMEEFKERVRGCIKGLGDCMKIIDVPVASTSAEDRLHDYQCYLGREIQHLINSGNEIIKLKQDNNMKTLEILKNLRSHDSVPMKHQQRLSVNAMHTGGSSMAASSSQSAADHSSQSEESAPVITLSDSEDNNDTSKGTLPPPSPESIFSLPESYRRPMIRRPAITIPSINLQTHLGSPGYHLAPILKRLCPSSVPSTAGTTATLKSPQLPPLTIRLGGIKTAEKRLEDENHFESEVVEPPPKFIRAQTVNTETLPYVPSPPPKRVKFRNPSFPTPTELPGPTPPSSPESEEADTNASLYEASPNKIKATIPPSESKTPVTRPSSLDELNATAVPSPIASSSGRAKSKSSEDLVGTPPEKKRKFNIRISNSPSSTNEDVTPPSGSRSKNFSPLSTYSPSSQRLLKSLPFFEDGIEF